MKKYDIILKNAKELSNVAEKKEKRYIIENAQLMSEWDWKRNSDLSLYPEELTCGANKKAWWVCSSCGHSWNAEINSRNRGRGCPVCAGKKVKTGFNDLTTLNPTLAAEWHPTKNGDLTPEMVTPRSGKKAWWICPSCGNEYNAMIIHRNDGTSCPYCAGKKVKTGYNDLLILNPTLAAEWHPTKNGDLTPDMVTPGSNKKAWWRCLKGHEWSASIVNRNVAHTGCPFCRFERQTSFPEQAILFYCSKITEAKSRNTEYGKELDVYLPKYHIGIEYNGIYYHKDAAERDKEKIKHFANKGIRVITIQEGTRNYISGDTIQCLYADSSKTSLNWAIKTLFELLEFPTIHIDVINDASEIFSQYVTIEKENSLAKKYPEIARDWNYDKNLSLTPDLVSNSSNKKVWWKCKKGHEWQATVNSRITGNGCPYCSGTNVIVGETDLKTTNPTLASEWNIVKNGDLTPEMVLPNSHKRVWWICQKCGQEWVAQIADRNKGKGCPYCAGQKVLKGFNDLQTANPTIANEWNYEKNSGLTPADVFPSSHRRVWWICSQGHEWQAVIGDRNRGRGCPQCAREKNKGKDN